MGPLWQARAPISTKIRSTHLGATKLRWVTRRCSPRVTPNTVTQYKTARAATACQLQKRGKRANTAPTCMTSMNEVVPNLNLRCRGGSGVLCSWTASRMRDSWAALGRSTLNSWACRSDAGLLELKTKALSGGAFAKVDALVQHSITTKI